MIGLHSRERRGGRETKDLELLRRLDWRFLLPEPVIGPGCRVGYAANTSASDVLARALDTSGAEVVRIPRPGHPSGAAIPQHGRGCDLLVARGSSPVVVAAAASLLKEGGWLYWEMTPDLGEGLPERLLGTGAAAIRGGRWIRRSTTRLRRLGFASIGVQGHHPDFDRCRWIVPLEGDAPRAFFLAHGAGGGIVGRVRSVVGRCRGALPGALLTPCISLVARKATADPGGGVDARA
jgi:hypothetical protein